MKIQGVRLQGTKLVPSGVAADLEVSRSLRFNSADSAYLNRTLSSSGNMKVFTLSFWLKRTALGVINNLFTARNAIGSGTEYFQIKYNANDTISVIGRDSGSVVRCDVSSTAVFRDPGAWAHIVISFNASSTTLNVYANNVVIANSTSIGNVNYGWNNSSLTYHRIGDGALLGEANLNGYMAELYHVDGQALEPSSFGETDTATGVWEPKAYTGTYGTNGFYLNFSDNSGTTSTTLGKDSSGNANNWTPNNFSVTAGVGNDSLVDSPTNYGTDTGAGGEVRGNYATMNPLRPASYGAAILTNGGLNAAQNTTAYVSSTSTVGVSSGKWYWEVTCGVAGFVTSIGITSNLAANGFTTGMATYHYDGTKYIGATNSAYGAAYTNNDVIGFALDLDAGTLVCYKNGASQGTLTSGLSGTYYAYTTLYGSNNVNFNFGQRPFVYTAPSGFKALCTQNLPTPTIGATSTTQANDYFNVVLYTGNGSTQSITGVGFQPDTVWLKGRSLVSNHRIYDAIRGATKSLYPDLTDAEGTESTGLTSFNSDGFSVGSQAGHNQNGSTYVAWNWKANGAGSSNTAGTITSTVSANTTSGFSIVTYTGTGANATVGHGLGVTPGMIIVKSRSSGVFNWAVWHTSLGGGDNALQLNNTGATYTAFDYWNGNPTSTVFTLGTDAGSNQSSGTYVAYCFAAVAGYSAFGSYTGNGGTDGPFVFANHRPAFLLVKRTDTTSNWTILDFQREGYNVDNDGLYPNLNTVEGTTDLADLLSSGFKLRSTDASVNASGGTYIYMSIASNPFKYARAR